MKKILFVLLGIVVLICGFIMIVFSSALNQEKNSIAILSSIIELEIGNRSYEQVVDENHQYQYVAENIGESRYEIVKKFMQQKEWDFKEQMGSGLIFQKSNRTITVETRQFSKYYFLWDVPKEIVN